jgi:hypothetical protein
MMCFCPPESRGIKVRFCDCLEQSCFPREGKTDNTDLHEILSGLGKEEKDKNFLTHLHG